MSLRTIALAAAMTLAASAASAVTTATFDLTRPGSGNDFFEVYSDDDAGVDMTVRGFKANGEAADVSMNVNGIGVRGAPEKHRVANGEYLRFTFSPGRVVSAFSVVFENSGGDYAVRYEGGPSPSSAPVTGGEVALFETLVDGVQSFDIIGTTANGGGHRGIRVASIRVDVVPLPPALFGVAGAFALAFGLRRTGRRADA